MNERWQRVADLFSRGTALQPEHRTRFLDIGDNSRLRHEVEALHQADAAGEDDRFLRTPINDARPMVGREWPIPPV
jgi:hypothetical protein